MIVAPDDGFARTHDEARAVIQYAVPGARVRFWREARTTSERGRSYEVALPRLGAAPIVLQAAYALPFNALAVAKMVRTRIDQCALSA